MSISITRRLEFDYGHRVWGHESKCGHVHGHRGVVDLEVTARELDKVGRVVDFSCLKSLVGGWIDEFWDHNMILCESDPLNCDSFAAQHGRKPYIMKQGRNTTAEYMAEELFEVARDLLLTWQIFVLSVTIHETPNCKATYRTW